VNADRFYVLLAALVIFFCAATFTMLSFRPVQWVGMDDFIGPAALVLWSIVVFGLIFAMTPYGKYVVRGGALFFVSYVTLLLYAMLGLVTMILYPLRLASGI